MATTLANISQWIGAGFARAQFVQSTAGRPYGPSLPTAGTGNGGMTILEGANAANLNLPAAEVTQISGDDGVRGAIQFPGNALPTFDLQFSDFKGTFVDTSQGTTEVDAQSVYDFFGLDPANRDFPDIFLLLTQRAVSTVAGSEGNGYSNIIFPLCTVSFTGPGNLQTGGNPNLFTFSVTVNRVSVLPWGTPLSTGTHGTTQFSGYMFFSQKIPTFEVFRQNNVLATYTPSQARDQTQDQAIAWDGAALGTPSTLAIGSSGADLTFTAQANNNVTTFLFEVA